MKKYSQLRAFRGAVRASFTAVRRSRSTIIFSIALPLVFVAIFGSLGNDTNIFFKVAIAPGADTSNPIYDAFVKSPNILLVNVPADQAKADLEEGRLLALVNLIKDSSAKFYHIKLVTSQASNQHNVEVLKQEILRGIISGIDEKVFPGNRTIAKIDEDVQTVSGRLYRTIDFILPGQLGFSLLTLGVTSIAVVLFNLRKRLIFKRVFATPVKPAFVLLGEVASRILFNILTVIIIVGVGVYVFGFTLHDGLATFGTIFLLSVISLLVFMGFGVLISGLCKEESAVAPFATFVTVPQLLLAGSFFDIGNFPHWLQPFCNVLPLSYFNDAMRSISFNGASLWDVRADIIPLLIWGVIVYGIGIKVFKYE
jgi:ABC-2 type transport system permease protein